MAIDPIYMSALRLLGRVCEEYRRRTDGDRAWLVGGASVVIFTDGFFHSGDFDLVAADEQLFEEIILEFGFIKENRAGHLKVGWYHPDYPDLGWQLVTGPLFDGRTDRDRSIEFVPETGSVLTLPPIEDVIADRLAQYAASRNSDMDLLDQALMLCRMARDLDIGYLRQRIADEGGDILLLGFDGYGDHP